MISLGTLINQGALVHRESEDGGLKSRGFSLRMGTLTKSGTLFAPMSPLSYAHPPSGNLPGMEFWENRKFHNLGGFTTRKHGTPTKYFASKDGEEWLTRFLLSNAAEEPYCKIQQVPPNYLVYASWNTTSLASDI